MILALLPAHNEEATIAKSIQGLLGQTQPPDQVVVIADNCTDATAAVAATYGATVYETVGNGDKKAGALNQYLARALTRDDVDHILIQNPSEVETETRR